MATTQDLSACTCCGAIACDCSDCATGFWTEFTFTIAGFLNQVGGTCDCPSLDGTWTVYYRGSCVWSTDEQYSNVDCGTGSYWTLYREAGGYRLVSIIEGLAIQLFSDPVNCVDAFDMTGGPLSGSCMPTTHTVTMTPGGAWTPCP